MNGSQPDALPPLGRKIEPTAPTQAEPQWKPMPGRADYETNGSAVRKTPESMATNPWAKYLHSRGLMP